MSTQSFKHLCSKIPISHRANLYVGLIAVVAVVALLAETAKSGHMFGLQDILDQLSHCVARFVADVSAAEVGAAAMFRIFGVGK